MARTNVPKLMDSVHDLSVYTIKYNSVIRPALQLLDPDAVTAYDALVDALQSLDALRTVLVPILGDF